MQEEYVKKPYRALGETKSEAMENCARMVTTYTISVATS